MTSYPDCIFVERVIAGLASVAVAEQPASHASLVTGRELVLIKYTKIIEYNLHH